MLNVGLGDFSYYNFADLWGMTLIVGGEINVAELRSLALAPSQLHILPVCSPNDPKNLLVVSGDPV